MLTRLNRPGVIVAGLVLAFLCPISSAKFWSTPAHTWGGGGLDGGNAVAVDSVGNVYVAGATTSFGAGGMDALLVKYTPTGALLWAKTWGGARDDYAIAVAVGPDGYIYVTGWTLSFGAGSFDIFLLKLAFNGTLVWGTTWGGGGWDQGNDIGFDASGNIYVVGETESYGPCCRSAVLLKFSPNGSVLWSTSYNEAFLDALGSSRGISLTVDSKGNVIIAGYTEWAYGPDLQNDTILLLKYDASGNLTWQEDWSTQGRGQDATIGFRAPTTDADGNIYLAGLHADECQTPSADCDFDALVLKLDSGGNFQWARTWGTAGTYDAAFSVALDSSRHLLVSGVRDLYDYRGETFFVLSYDTSGNILSQAGWSGPATHDVEGAMALDKADNAYVVAAALNNTGAWAATTATRGTLNDSLAHFPYSTEAPTGAMSPLTNQTVDQTKNGVVDSGGGGSDLFIAQLNITQIAGVALAFPVKNNSRCKNGTCAADTAPITAVFDHDMRRAYESPRDPKQYCSLVYSLPGYGQVTAFTTESASANPSSQGFGVCKDLYGYQNPGISQFLTGYYYPPGNVLWYDSHPAFDYAFKYGTPIYPATGGCVSYKVNVPGLASPENGHVLTIIPRQDPPVGGFCQEPLTNAAGYAPGYAIVYMHLSSYFDDATKTVMKCVYGGPNPGPSPSDCAPGSPSVQPCPECAQEGQWVSADINALIGYTGNFLRNWGGVRPHLHFEVDLTAKGTTRPVDPYGWDGTATADPYTPTTGFFNPRLWK